MGNQRTYFGKVASYDREKHIGFIEMDNSNEVAFFYFDRTMQLAFVKNGGHPAHQFSFGDELSFKLNQSRIDPSKIEAYDLNFIRNQRIELLIKESKEKGILRGYIKKHNSGKWMIKHAASYVHIPIQITDWEINIDKVYATREDEIVNFKLTQTEQLHKLAAVVEDAQFAPEYYQLIAIQKSEEIIAASLVGKNEDGYFTTILNRKVDAFIPISRILSEAEKVLLSNLKRGDTLPTRVKNIYPNRRVSLILVS
jgi:hypothetical protein